MSEYTSTHEGYERAMKWSLTGPPEGAKDYCEALFMPTFHNVNNGQRLEYEDHLKGIEAWRAKVSDYEAKLEEFLRDGDLLAARLTGTIKISGAENAFESNMYAKIDAKTGKISSMTERSLWGPIGKDPEVGIKLIDAVN